MDLSYIATKGSDSSTVPLTDSIIVRLCARHYHRVVDDFESSVFRPEIMSKSIS